MHFEDQRSGFHMSPRRNLPYRGSSDHHLRQISGEAQKLRQMIDSWPTERSFHIRKKKMAADLLRGALGLQESLVTLGKIEEACKLMVQASKEQEHGFCFTQEDFTAEMGMQAMGSRRFDARVHQHGLRAARNLRSSRNCVEELKKVIRDSLHRQNLVSIPSENEKPCPSQSRKASTGDSEDCKQKHGAESSGCAEAAQQKKGRAPNLIARLMGLEEGPPEEFRPVKRTERGKDSSPRRPFIALDTPEVGKLPLMEERPDSRREMLQEIKKSTHFKGPGSIEQPQIGSPVEGNAGNFPAGDQVPALVIIRPMHSTSLEMEGMKKSRMEADPASVYEKFALELVKETENRAEKAVVETGKAATSDKTRLPASPHDQKQLKKKASRTSKKTKGTQKAVGERSTCEEKRKIRSMTASGSEAAVESSTCEEKRKIRSMTASGSEIKENSTPKNPEKDSGKVKNHVLTQRGTLHHEDQDSKKPASRSHIDTARGRRVMRAKPRTEHMPIIVKQADTPNCKQENKEIIPAQEKGVSQISSTLPPDLLHSGTERQGIANKRDVSGCPVENETKENALKLSSVIADTTRKPSFHCEVLPNCNHSGGNLGPSHEPNSHPSGENRIPVPSESFDHIKSPLLSSPSFLHAQEFFNLHHQQPTERRRIETEKVVAEDNSKLLLDCAGELMAYKHYHYELANHPLWMNCLRTSVIQIHMNWLVDEISREIEELDCSGGASIAGASGDSLYTRLEEDVKCERMWKNGAWEQGWNEAIPVEGGDRVACDVEKHVLEVLVEEIALEFLG